MSKHKVAIIGTGQTKFKTHLPDKIYPELAREAAQKALEQAKMTFDEIDAVVFAMSPTQFMGVNDGEKWTVGALGGIKKPFMRVHTGGATGGSAAQAGYYHVASGLYEKVLVVGADKVAETPNTQRIFNFMWDPFFETHVPLNTITMVAVQAHRHMQKYGTTEEQMASVAVRSWSNAMLNPHAHLKGHISIDDVMESRMISWPIKLYDACPRSSGGVAVIMTSENVTKEKCNNPAWVKGIGGITNTVYIGDRLGKKSDADYANWDELAMAAKKAYKMAGITNPVNEIDVAEIYAPFTINEINAVEALGFCQKGEGGNLSQQGFFDLDGSLPINPSGGVLCSNPIAVSGLARVCEATLQVMGKAGDRQMKKVNNAVATAVGGSLQFHNLMVLGKD